MDLFGAKPLYEPMLFFVGWTLGNMFQIILNINVMIFIDNFENVICKLAAILYLP